GPRGPQADVCLTMPLPKAYDPAIAEGVARLETMPRPGNLGAVPTWNPEAGLITPVADLFGDSAASAQRENDYWRAIIELNGRVLASYGLEHADRKRIITFLTGVIDPWADHPRDVALLPATVTTRVLQGKTVSTDPLGQNITVE